jgi:large subunit ribosomal protein L35
MPKLKVRKAAAKRFTKKKNGKIFKELAFKSHLLESKSPSKKRGFHRKSEIAGPDYCRMKRLLAGMAPN